MMTTLTDVEVDHDNTASSEAAVRHLRGGVGANICDATTSWQEQRGGVKDGPVRRLHNKR
jgi:hypothetical protein